MSPADYDLLSRLTILASVTPCTVAKADLLRLIDLAGMRDLQVWRDVEGGADPALVLPAGLMEMIGMVRRGR